MRALTHVPSPNLDHGQRLHIARTLIDYTLAVQQHDAYCRLLHGAGATVSTLDVNRDLPDSTFIEDTAIVLDELAVLASMGTTARRGELTGVAAALGKYRPLQPIEPPATIEGGDVLRVGRTLLVGMSPRTNRAGIEAFEAIVGRFGYRVLPVVVRRCLHLKTACTALPDGRLLVNPSWLEMSALHEFKQVAVPKDEPWAANILLLGTTIIMAAEHGQTTTMLRSQGMDVRTISLSEFAKAEGGVTCLSLLFDEAG